MLRLKKKRRSEGNIPTFKHTRTKDGINKYKDIRVIKMSNTVYHRRTFYKENIYQRNLYLLTCKKKFFI